jgi:iron complex transport system ATP-binding protein
MIGIEAVSKGYGGSLVVDDVSLTIPKGKLTGIIGPNGAGKSTLLGIMARLLEADRGRVTVDGLDVRDTPGRDLAKRLSVLKQDNAIAARLTVRDLVGFGRFPHGRGRMSADDHAHVDRALDYLQLQELSGRFLDELSGGQRQRAHVAMALCQDTDHMLFDEPLASLDIRHAVAMMDLLRRTAREFDKAVVVVLHDLNIAANFSDAVIAMKQGRVAAHGSVEEAMTAERLSAIYGLPVRVHAIDGQRVVTYAAPPAVPG